MHLTSVAISVASMVKASAVERSTVLVNFSPLLKLFMGCYEFSCYSSSHLKEKGSEAGSENFLCNGWEDCRNDLHNIGQPSCAAGTNWEPSGWERLGFLCCDKMSNILYIDIREIYILSFEEGKTGNPAEIQSKHPDIGLLCI